MRLGANSAPSLRIVVTDDDPKLLITIVEMLVKAAMRYLLHMTGEAHVSSPSTSLTLIW
jgi:hypothetical protein